jgi:hypothetical protein
MSATTAPTPETPRKLWPWFIVGGSLGALVASLVDLMLLHDRKGQLEWSAAFWGLVAISWATPTYGAGRRQRILMVCLTGLLCLNAIRELLSLP